MFIAGRSWLVWGCRASVAWRSPSFSTVFVVRSDTHRPIMGISCERSAGSARRLTLQPEIAVAPQLCGAMRLLREGLHPLVSLGRRSRVATAGHRHHSRRLLHP